MNPIMPAIFPVQTGGYVPYFYEKGLFLAYDVARQRRPTNAYRDTQTPYDFSSDGRLEQRLFSTMTVEDVIARGYLAVPPGEPITAIITDRAVTSHLGLDDIIGQIRKRYEIYQHNLYEIELAKCSAINVIYHHEAYHGPGSADSRQHYAKHKALADLYEEQRRERGDLWRDVSRLHLALPETAQQYLTAYRKLAILASAGGDAQ